MKSTEARKNAQAMYAAVNDYTKEDLALAIDWARNSLLKAEGEGHIFNVTANKEGKVQCCFSKPEWAGEHSSSYMESGSEAVVMAVCEYLCGL